MAEEPVVADEPVFAEADGEEVEDELWARAGAAAESISATAATAAEIERMAEFLS